MDKRTIIIRIMQVMDNNSNISISKITKIQEAQQDILLPLPQVVGKLVITLLLQQLRHNFIKHKQHQQLLDIKIKHKQAVSIMAKDRQSQI